MSDPIKVLYIFPHPDDESFGPAPVIHRQKSVGHEVYLLTLTKGGATSQRHKYHYTVEEMSEVRFREMLDVEQVLKLDGMTVLDYPDGGLCDINPLELEEVVKKEIRRVEPNIVVTYPIHGVSGHFDHITIHHIVKRVFNELKQNDEDRYLKRLCFFTLSEDQIGEKHRAGVKASKDEHIDCTVFLDETDIISFRKSLHSYKTYEDVIQSTDVVNKIGNKVHFEIYNEDFNPPIEMLSDGL